MLGRGSETDQWFRTLGQQCIERRDAADRGARRPERRDKERHAGGSTRPRTVERKKSRGNLREAEPDGAAGGEEGGAGFPYRKAYRRLLNMFRVHPSPHAKLNALNELERLMAASLPPSGSRRPRASRSDAGSGATEAQGPGGRPTQLEETMDNVKERRSAPWGGATGTDAAVTRELRALFRDASTRPRTLFRDLQLIASFVPASVLDRPDRGRAFWNAGLAGLQVKAETCRTMEETADEVIAAHARARKSPGEGGARGEAGAHGLDDAGRMLVITAKEGCAAAQRELALFYLSHPEFVERTTVPLSRPRELFKQAVMERYGRAQGGAGDAAGGGVGGGGGKEGGGDVRNDAGLMCVTVHWMEAAEQGGGRAGVELPAAERVYGAGVGRGRGDGWPRRCEYEGGECNYLCRSCRAWYSFTVDS